MTNINDYNSPIKPTWCPGCGNFGIFQTIKKSLVELEIEPHEVVLVFDIGCSGNMADKIGGYGFNALHGRAIPVAIGVKLANPDLHVIAIGGDGGFLEEGVSHTLWGARSNYDINVILHNNQIYGLTTGQPTVTSEKGHKGKTAPRSSGIVEDHINPAQLVMTAKGKFIARSFAGDIVHLNQTLKETIKNKGFSFLEVLQPCVTYNKHNTYAFFKERIYKLEEDKKYDVQNWEDAFKTAGKWKKRIATGVIYNDKNALSYKERLPQRQESDTTPVKEVKAYNIDKTIKEFE